MRSILWFLTVCGFCVGVNCMVGVAMTIHPHPSDLNFAEVGFLMRLAISCFALPLLVVVTYQDEFRDGAKPSLEDWFTVIVLLVLTPIAAGFASVYYI